MSSNTQRTLKAFKEQGYLCGMVERWIPITGIPQNGKRSDLFGIIDIIAIRARNNDDLFPQIVGIQSCGQAFAEHHKKIMASENTMKWLSAGAKLELWGWRKVKKKRGQKQMIWKPRIMRYFRYKNKVIGVEQK